IEFIANIVRLYRGEDTESEAGSAELMKQNFPKGKYVDIAGLCRVASLPEIEAQGWSPNPGRYVGVAERAADDFEFTVRLEELNEELETLNAEARELVVPRDMCLPLHSLTSTLPSQGVGARGRLGKRRDW